MNKIKVKKLVLLSMIITLSNTYSQRNLYMPNIEILSESDYAFARYTNGLIYIGDSIYLNSLCSLNKGDILVEDDRYCEYDPKIKIYSSYEINDKKIRNEILLAICEYEKCYPSSWNRSIDSMKLEWLIHNISYSFNYKKGHSSDVDLNNDDEEKYNNEILKKIYKLWEDI